MITPDLDAGTTLSLERTAMAAERTLMAWIRTALAMITLGFTIGKLGEVANVHLLPGRDTDVDVIVALLLSLLGILAFTDLVTQI